MEKPGPPSREVSGELLVPGTMDPLDVPPYGAFTDRIRKLVKLSGRSPSALCRDAGISRGVYKRLLAGAPIEYPNLLRLARILRVPVQALTNEPDNHWFKESWRMPREKRLPVHDLARDVPLLSMVHRPMGCIIPPAVQAVSDRKAITVARGITNQNLDFYLKDAEEEHQFRIRNRARYGHPHVILFPEGPLIAILRQEPDWLTDLLRNLREHRMTTMLGLVKSNRWTDLERLIGGTDYTGVPDWVNVLFCGDTIGFAWEPTITNYTVHRPTLQSLRRELDSKLCIFTAHEFHPYQMFRDRSVHVSQWFRDSYTNTERYLRNLLSQKK